jgi:OOP family OmpA-OmpF porin
MSRKLNQRLKELDKSPNGAPRNKGGTPPPTFGREAASEPPVELAAFIMFALFGMLILMGLATLFGIRDVQEDVARRATAALAEVGVTDVTVKASGFDVSVNGTTDSQEKREAAIALDGRVANVGTWDFENLVVFLPQETVEVKVQTEPILISWSFGRAIVTGTLSATALRDQLDSGVDGIFSSADTAGLGVTEGAPTEDWVADLIELTSLMASETNEGEIVVNPAANLIQVSTETETRQAQRNLRDKVEDELRASNITFQFSSGITAKDVVRVTREQVEQTQATLDEIIDGKVVEFEFGSAELTLVGRGVLNELLEGLEENPLVGVEIAGHTDNVGTPEENQLLSEERAMTVMDYFVSRGQDPARFVIIGFGENEPIDTNATAEGRARNRRIVFTALMTEEEEE